MCQKTGCLGMTVLVVTSRVPVKCQLQFDVARRWYLLLPAAMKCSNRAARKGIGAGVGGSDGGRGGVHMYRGMPRPKTVADC